MQRLSLFLLSLLLLFATACSERRATATAEAPTEVPTYSISQFMDNDAVYAANFSHDNSALLVSGNQSGVFNVYRMELPSGEMTPLTQSDTNTIYAVSYFPEDDRVLFRSDGGGDEVNHLYLLETDGTVRDLNPKEGVRTNFGGWSEDLKSFYYTSNERDARFEDLYEVSIDDFSREMIFQNDGGFSYGDMSDKGEYISLQKSITTSTNEMYLYDTEEEAMIRISPEGAKESYSSAFFGDDDLYLYYTTTDGSEFSYLARYDIATGQSEEVKSYDWDVAYAYQSYKDRYRVIGLNADARTELQVIDQDMGREIDFPAVPAGDISGVRINRDETLMTFTVGSSRQPSDLYLYDISENKLTRLTNNLNPEIDADNLVEGQNVRFESFDGMEIPALLYKPKIASADNPVPAIVWVHGGPGGQSRLNYFAPIQHLVNHGYTILAVNNRGSSGYGKSFYRADDRRHGEDDLMDIVESKDYLGTLDWVDTSRVAIMGGSYGGYMTMAALTYQPEVFDAGVNIFGVTNWLRTLKSIPPWWESFREALYEELGDPNTEDSVRLRRISPLFHADQVNKPLLVLQGANDPRVLQVESDEIVEAVRENGVPVEYVLFEDEGHGFRKKENEVEGYGKVLEFLDEHLK